MADQVINQGPTRLEFLREKLGNLFEYIKDKKVAGPILDSLQELQKTPDMLVLFIFLYLMPFFNQGKFDRPAFKKKQDETLKNFVETGLVQGKITNEQADEILLKTNLDEEVETKLHDYFEMFCDILAS